MTLTRTDLELSRLQAIILQAGLKLQILTEVELQQSIAQILQQRSSFAQDVWIFAYGSLVWNPIIKFSDRLVGTIYGRHRRFCLWTPIGRGTPEHPGLVLGLERGGSCRGVVYRIPAADVAVELQLLWRREMIAGAYISRWVKVFIGNKIVDAIAFVINRQHPLYAGILPLETTIHTLATASGHLGSSRDYLLHTIDGLATMGIQDASLLALRDQVIAQSAVNPIVRVDGS